MDNAVICARGIITNTKVSGDVEYNVPKMLAQSVMKHRIISF